MNHNYILLHHTNWSRINRKSPNLLAGLKSIQLRKRIEDSMIKDYLTIKNTHVKIWERPNPSYASSNKNSSTKLLQTSLRNLQIKVDINLVKFPHSAICELEVKMTRKANRHLVRSSFNLLRINNNRPTTIQNCNLTALKATCKVWT